jgi:membrane AbrB-like protein
VIAVAEELKADLKKIAITQSIRLLTLVEAIPLVALAIGHPTEALPTLDRRMAGPVEIGILVAAGATAALALNAIRIPGGWVIGGLVATAALHLSGIVEGHVPDFLTVPAMIGLGALAGSRFRPGDLAILPRIAAPALGALVIASVVSGVAAISVTLIFGIGLIQTLLAFAPGAQEALTVLAFEMDVDPAYVAAHHVVRFLTLVAAVPLLARWLANRP